MTFVRHLQVTLQSATFMDPLSSSLDERMVYVKASHKNIVYTTNVVEDIGIEEHHYMWGNDGTNVFHFAYEDNSEDITLELFNRDHICIGISRLHLEGLEKVTPEQDPEMKTLPVSALDRRWSYARLALTAQIKRQQAMGKLGNLNVVLQEGIINSSSWLISPAATEPRVSAKLIYKHTTYTIGILRGERNKFVWHEHFTFRINSWDPVDVLEICIYYGAFQVGECKVLLSLFINLEEDLQADRKDFVIRTEDLLVDKRAVGSIKVAGSFSALHELDVLRAVIMGKRPESHPPGIPPLELPGLTNYASITNEIQGEGKIEADIFHTDKSKPEVQLESKEIRNAGKPTSIGDYLPIDLTRDLLGASSRGYVIRTICPDGQGGWYSCALKRINTMDESEPDLARLCHPHVVHLFHHWKKKIDYGEVRECMPKSTFMTFLMMELMDGDLGKLMTSIMTTGLSPFSLLVAVHVMLQIAKGMLYLHEMGVSHPHLKCNNVLCRVKSTAQIPFRVGDVLVKLGGFGCSRAANDDTKNRDLFCFGLTCLEILTGNECFEDIYGADKDSRPSIPETTPCILKDCIASCLDTKITFSEAITLLLLAQSQIIQTCEDKMILCSVNPHIKSTLSNNQDLTSSSTTSKSDRQEMFHVHQLHPQLGEVATSVQITLIFFHGFPKVSEEWRMTWLTRDNRLVWPQMWLPEDLDGDIRVLSVSFDDRPSVSNGQSIKELLQILVISATCKLGDTDQAIVLVGHSFGGVIIKALIAAAQGLAGKTVENNVEFQEVLKCKKFLKRLASIVFYSVPHAFTNMEFENYISGCSNTRVLQRSFLLKALRRDSAFISDMIQLSRDFENAVPRKTKLLAFLEGKPMSKKSLLVTENSLELLSWEWHKVDRDNHFEVCRPVSKSHIGYEVLLNHLQQHMCSPSAVNVTRVWKVIGTVLICICKFKVVLSKYRIIKCFIADITAGRLGVRHNPTGLFTSAGYRNYDSLDGPRQLLTSAKLRSVLGSSGIPGLAASSGTGLDNDIRSFDRRQRCNFFAANIQDHVKKEEDSDGDVVIGLKFEPYLRTYFSEATTAGGLGMRHRARSWDSPVPMCQAEGCKADLITAKQYHRRHKVCELHTKAPTVIVGGQKQRFCQQCSRFHVLSEFDEGKRSCRRRLAGHNERRRKPHPNTSTSGGPPAESIGIKPGEDGDLYSGVNRTNDPKSMLNMHLQQNCGSPSSASLEDSDEKPGTPGIGNLQLRTAGPGFAQYVIKALGTTDAMTDDMICVLSKFDHRFSNMNDRNLEQRRSSSDPPTSHQHEHEDFVSRVLNSALEDAEKVIVLWDMDYATSHRWIFESTEEDARTYLDAVDEILTKLEIMKIHNCDPKLLEEAQHLLQLAMKRLEEELQHVLERYTGFVDPDVLIDSVSAKSFRGEDEDEEDGDEEKLHARKLERTQSKAVALLPAQAAEDVLAIVTRLIAGGFKKECVQVYISSRKIVLERSLEALGVERMSIEEVQKMPWELQEEKIRKWNQAMKVGVLVLFASEKQLCDQVFAPPLADICFNEFANSEMLHLLSFGDAIALSRRSPEKFFKVLDIYDTLRFLIPDLELTFSGTSGTSVRSSASDVLSHLGEAARATFTEFELAIQRDSSRVPVMGGSVHPLTRYVMNYIKFACDYTDTLKLAYGETTQTLTLTSPVPRSHHSNSPDDRCTREEASPLANQINRVAQVLQANLEGKAKLYRDPALRHVFLMNNIHYVMQKVKSSEVIFSFFGDIWVRRQVGMLREAAASYLREWTEVLACLRDEGLHNKSGLSSIISMKDTFEIFNTIFDEVHRTQSQWVVLDPMLRDELRNFIADKVLPAYSAFLGRYEHYIETGRHPGKDIKYTVEDLEMAIGEFFMGSTDR